MAVSCVPYLREASPVPPTKQRLQMCWRHVEVVEVEIRQGWILKAEDQPILRLVILPRDPGMVPLTPVLED